MTWRVQEINNTQSKNSQEVHDKTCDMDIVVLLSDTILIKSSQNSALFLWEKPDFTLYMFALFMKFHTYKLGIKQLG